MTDLTDWHYADEHLHEVVRDRYPARDVAAAERRWARTLAALAATGDEDASAALAADGRDDEAYADALERLRRRAAALGT